MSFALCKYIPALGLDRHIYYSYGGCMVGTNKFWKKSTKLNIFLLFKVELFIIHEIKNIASKIF